MLARADLGARMLADAYAGTLRAHWHVTDSDCYDEDYAQAYLVRRTSPAEVCLVIPGTGHRGKAGRSEFFPDWWRNVASGLGMAWEFAPVAPKVGASGIYRWGRGWLEAANALDDWLTANNHKVDVVFGHSAGAAIGQILVWSRVWRFHRDMPGYIRECHAIATPRPSLSAGAPIYDEIHCWTAPDDPVCRLPTYGWHVGHNHKLPVIPGGTLATRHGLVGYRHRFALELARVREMVAAKEMPRG